MKPPQGRMIRTSLLAVLLGALVSVSVSALNPSTHGLVNRQAALTPPSLDEYIRTSLGFSSGLNTSLRSGVERFTILEWLEQGGAREDSPLVRSLRHFHDPLQPWDRAGLSMQAEVGGVPVGPQFESSVRWMQAQGGNFSGGAWSWRDARDLYYRALTERDPVQREALWADTFRAVGQIMHLVVDASNPEHARNTAHANLFRHPLGSYEYWVSDGPDGHGVNNATREGAFIARFLEAPIGFDRSILRTVTGDAVAIVPIARLIDSNVYVGANPSVTFNADDPRASMPVGLAEISNANFFANGTFTGQYPNPTLRDPRLTRQNVAAPRPGPFGDVRAYTNRPAGLGLLPATPLAAVCASEKLFGGLTPEEPCMDDRVWRQIGEHMLPRAVGYARGVLDYFFRGSMRVHTLYRQGGNTFIQIENLANEEMEGVFEVHARPLAKTPREGREKVGLVNGGAVTTVSPNATVTLPVTLLPAENPTASQLLVFRGRLGLEQDAVAAQIFDVPHVLIVQSGETAHMVESCSESVFFVNIHTKSCNWVPGFHEVTGELVTDVTVPVIARVSAGSALWGSVDLELDGVPIPGRVWRRQGTDPDPRRFRLRGRASHGLMVTVQLVNGTVVSTPMAVLLMATGVAQKSFTYLTYWHYQDPPWYVEAERTARIRVTAHPSYRTLSISGYPNPTNIVTDRFGSSRLLDEILVGNAISSETSYRQRWIDHAQLFSAFPPGGPVILNQQLQALFDPLPFGPVPVVPWEADVERAYEPAELEFLKTFVTSVPSSQRFTMVGRLPDS